MNSHSTKLLLRGYGPLAVLAILFILMATFVPTIEERGTSAEAGVNRTVPGTTSGTTGDGQDGQPVTGGDTTSSGSNTGTGGGSADGTTGNGGTSISGGGSGTAGQAQGGSGACQGRDKQLPGDPYSPPCTEWSGGDNGGNTTRGVTEDKITLSFRITGEKGFNQTLASLAGAEIQDQPRDIERTVSAFEAFFNEHFQFYGRELDVVFYEGKGSETEELLGGGQAEARADAKTVAEEIGAFAELNGATKPFTDALDDQGVVAFGTPYLSRDYHIERRPYEWSIATDCSIVSEVAAELTNKALAGKDARFAGGDLQNQTRFFAGLAPENPWYQNCADNAEETLQEAGNDFGIRVKYKLDIPSFSNQAANVIAKMKSEGVTTILCGCDPIFPVFLSQKAAEQNYHPEWVVLGTALTDWDVSAQLYEQDQWSRAFGVSSRGEERPIRAGLGYAAYKSVRDDAPAFTVEPIYGTMLMIASGIQMAGPDLTPNTFEQGMFAWPGGTGPFGTWGFGPGNYTPTRDYKILWWDPDRTSIVNKEAGSYVTMFDGERFQPGQLPSGDLPFFEE